MQKLRHHYFRWTPRTARITFIYVAVIPSIMGYVAYQTDVSQKKAPTNPQLCRLTMKKGLWDMRAKRKGDMMRDI